MPAGVGYNLPLVVVAKGQYSNDNILVSYISPTITTILPNNTGPTSGGILVTLKGENFGSPPLSMKGDLLKWLKNVNFAISMIPSLIGPADDHY